MAQGVRFQEALLEFRVGFGKQGDGPAKRGVHPPRFCVVQKGADDHIQVPVSIWRDIANGPAVHTTANFFKCGDAFHGTEFGRTRHRAHGKCGAHDIDRRDIVPQRARHAADHLMHRGEGVNAKQFIHLHRVGRGHPAEVVADEVDDHDIFRLLLFARRQGRFQGAVFFFGGTSFHGALDGLRMKGTSSFGQKPFRTRAHGSPLARLDVRGMGGPGLFGKPLKNGPTRGTRGFPSPWHAEVHFVDVSAP